MSSPDSPNSKPSQDPNDAEAAAREKAARVERIGQFLVGMVPHNGALGMRFVDEGPGMAVMLLPYDVKLVGDPERGTLHGGAVTSLIDATCGAAALLKIGEGYPVATLDLRIDYLRAAKPGRGVLARADCHRVTRNVAFVRAVAFHEGDPLDLETAIATAAGTFMINGPGYSILERRPAPTGGAGA